MACDTGVTVWDASLVLSFLLCKHPELVEGKRVLELGSGTGLLGVICGRLGAIVKSKRVLELGSGTGLLGVICGRLGAESVLITDLTRSEGKGGLEADCPESVLMTDLSRSEGKGGLQAECPVAARMREAVIRNCPGRDVRFAPLEWGTEDAERVLHEHLEGRAPDVILCADLIYDTSVLMTVFMAVFMTGRAPDVILCADLIYEATVFVAVFMAVFTP
ncbi:hypothetical protein T484DRAFT_1844596 [Baffinella frigidus]|nr:hypothetical protein T484DRAFT_1844596 [Cryptophyta sp. CCMP2293]